MPVYLPDNLTLDRAKFSPANIQNLAMKKSRTSHVAATKGARATTCDKYLMQYDMRTTSLTFPI